MNIHYQDGLKQVLMSDGFYVKALLNQNGIFFFRSTIQHREMKIHGFSYEDDYQGNAMAATIRKGRIDIRYHASYPHNTVSGICDLLFSRIELAWAKDYNVLYQGKTITIGPQTIDN